MHRHLLLAGLLCGALWVAPPVAGQGTPEAKAPTDELSLLKKENELLKKENELLKKENELLKKEAGRTDSSKAGNGNQTGKPTAEADGVDYVMEKVVRRGTTWTLEVSATNSNADRRMEFYGLEANDTDGNTYKAKFPRPIYANLRKEVKSKVRFVIPEVPAEVTEMTAIELYRGPRNLKEYPIGVPYPKLVFKKVQVSK
jgi:hypothetical protein